MDEKLSDSVGIGLHPDMLEGSHDLLLGPLATLQEVADDVNVRPSDADLEDAFLLGSRDQRGELGVRPLIQQEGQHIYVAVLGSHVQRRLPMSIPPIQYVIVRVDVVHVLLRVVVDHLFNLRDAIETSTIEG
jgi:hypothetical protein